MREMMHILSINRRSLFDAQTLLSLPKSYLELRSILLEIEEKQNSCVTFLQISDNPSKDSIVLNRKDTNVEQRTI